MCDPRPLSHHCYNVFDSWTINTLALPKSCGLLRETEAALWPEDDVLSSGGGAGEGWTLASELRTVREQLRLLADPVCGVLCSTGCCAKE